MTTYTFDALVIAGTYNWVLDEEDIVYAQTGPIELISSDNISTFTYTIDGVIDEGDGNFSYDVTVPDFGDLYYLDNVYDETTGAGAGVSIQGVYDVLGGDTEGTVSTISWTDGVDSYETTLLILSYYYDVPGQDYELWVDVVIYLDGDPLPTIDDIYDMAALDAGITGQSTTTPTGFGEGDSISITGIGGSITQADDFVGNENYDDVVYLGDGIDRFNGLSGEDTIYGDNGRDILHGGDDNDLIEGGADGDKLYGDEGDDTIYGGSGSDGIYGGSGNDYLDGMKSGDKIRGNSGHDTIIGGAGRDKLYGDKGQDTLYGGTQEDRLDGGSHNDLLYGEDDNDVLYGRQGADQLFGGDGNDELYGGKNEDVLYGGLGDDTLHGGSHADEFHFDMGTNEGNDVILDFEVGLDKIVLDDYAGSPGYTVNDDGTDTLITFDSGTTVLLENVTGADMGDVLLYA